MYELQKKRISLKWRSLLAALSCVAIAVAYMPSAVWATDSESAEDASSASEQTASVQTVSGSEGEEVFHQLTEEKTPAGYDESDLQHPYGYGKTKVNTILRKSSMLKYFGSTDRSKDQIRIFNGYNGKGGWGTTTEKLNAKNDFMRGFIGVQSVCFDGDGDGLDQDIAFVGICRNASIGTVGYVYIWTMNADTCSLPTQYVPRKRKLLELGEASWTNSLNASYLINALSITAGDYNNDGKESVVVYAALDGDNYGLAECKPDSEDGELVLSNLIYGEKGALNPAYVKNTSLCTQTIPSSKLICSLATGDANGDGIDDIITASGCGITNKTEEIEATRSYTGTIFGQNGLDEDSSILQQGEISGEYITSNGKYVFAAGVDIGGVSTDGSTKIVTAGYPLPDTIPSDIGIMCTTEAVCVYDINRKGAYSQVENFTVNIDSYLSICNSTQHSPTHCMISCIAVNGVGQQEHIFLDGEIYQISQAGTLTNKGKLDYDYTDDQPRDFVNVKVGNFDNDAYGCEEIIVTYDSKDDYSSAMINGNASYTDATLKQCDSYKTHITVETSEKNYNEAITNILFEPVELQDTDTVRVRLNTKGYFYSNIEPVAVLQSAPYFSETGGGGTTAYGVTYSFTSGEGVTNNGAIGGGFAENFGIGSLKQAFVLVYKQTMSSDYKKQVRNAYTTTFTSTGKDTVVLMRTPVVFYSYDVYDDTTKTWKENQMGLTFAQSPLYSQITVDQYNAFVDYYNSYVTDEKNQKQYTYGGETKTVKSDELASINKDNYYMGDAGTPESYASSWSSLPSGTVTSKGSYALGYQGGTTTSNFANETSETKTHTKGWTLDMTFTLQLGGKLPANALDGWVGGSFNGSKGTSKCRFTTEGNGYNISGTVKNIDIDSLTKSNQLPADSVTDYGFQWTFGMSEFATHKTGSELSGLTIPVAGYVVNNVTRGLSKPKLTELAASDDEINIKWEAPQTKEGQTLTGYNVYVGDIDGNYTKVTEDPVSADTTGYTYPVSGSSAYYEFVVTAVGTNASGKTIESLASNKKATIVSPQKEEITIGVKDQTVGYGEDVTLTKDDLILPTGIDASDINTDNLGWVTLYTAGKDTGSYGVRPKGITSTKYKISYDEGIIDVTPKTLHVTDLGAEASDKTYDGTTDASGKVKVISGLINSDVVKVEYDSARFSDAEPGESKTVTFTGLTLTGTKAGNYTLDGNEITAKASITKASALVWAAGGTTQKYSGKEKNITASSLPKCGTQVKYYQLDADGNILAKADSPTAVGDYMYVITLDEASSAKYEVYDALSYDEAELIGKNYNNLDSSNIGIMTITENVEETLYFNNSVVNKTYGDKNFIQQARGGVDGAAISYEVIDGEDYADVDAESGMVTIKKPGTSLIRATAQKEGYEPARAYYVVNIDKKGVTLKLDDGAEITYNGTDIDIPYQVEGEVSGNKIAAEDINFRYTNASDARDHTHKNAGDYIVTASLNHENEYYITYEEATAEMTILAKALVITPSADQSKMVGQYDPDFAYEADGLIQGDELTGKLSRAKGESAGEYAYALGTLANSNYALSIDESAPTFEIQAAAVKRVPKFRVFAYKKYLKATWNKVDGADGYMVYATYTGNSYGSAVKTVSAATNSVKITKKNGKTLNMKKNFKLYVAAYKNVNGAKKVFLKSAVACLAGAKSTKYTNAKSIKITSGAAVSLKKGNTLTVKKSTVKVASKKNLLKASLLSRYRYETSADYIAKVSSTGKITAVGPGTCYIYVYAQNGRYSTVKVTVEE